METTIESLDGFELASKPGLREDTTTLWNHFELFTLDKPGSVRPVRQPCDHSGEVRPSRIAILYSAESPRTVVAVNHTQVARP
ncbi:hypothetical protein YC2023_004807 [Brassica napus]